MHTTLAVEKHDADDGVLAAGVCDGKQRISSSAVWNEMDILAGLDKNFVDGGNADK